MTITEPQLCTSAPTTGFKTPVTARATARKFSPMEKIRNHKEARLSSSRLETMYKFPEFCSY